MHRCADAATLGASNMSPIHAWLIMLPASDASTRFVAGGRGKLGPFAGTPTPTPIAKRGAEPRIEPGWRRRAPRSSDYWPREPAWTPLWASQPPCQAGNKLNVHHSRMKAWGQLLYWRGASALGRGPGFLYRGAISLRYF
jgi:hypothetical protein